MPQNRQLAAIMFTDIEGYTSLMQQNEKEALRIRDKHRNIFNSTTAKYQGKVLQYFGDGTLSIFNSAIDAVKCAIEMQQSFQKDPIVPVRIGIHTGDIILRNDEIIGDSVNLAARIEALAIAGSILISNKVYDEIKNQDTIKTEFLNKVKLKNISSPVDVYAVSHADLIVPKREELSIQSELSKVYSDLKSVKKKSKTFILGLSFLIISLITFLIYFTDYLQNNESNSSNDDKRKSIAVLAFENMSGDPDQEYFSDGISEEILNSLAKLENLKVTGRTSAFSFKGKNEDIRSIGQKLNVQMILEGSVRKADNQFRITAQLINVEDGYHLWSETYDREMDNIFKVQEDIANNIAEKLQLQIIKIDNNRRKTENIEAYELFLKGTHFFKKDLTGTKKAMEYFQKAIELDPNYAEAYAYIGETYLHLAGYNLMPTKEAYSKSRSAAEKSIELNPYGFRGFKVLSYINLFYDWNWKTASLTYSKALKYGLTGQNEFILFYEIFLNEDYENAIATSKKIIEADPLDVVSYWQLGICYYFAKDFNSALGLFNDALKLDPNYADGHHWKGLMLGYLGEYEKAFASLNKALELTSGEGFAKIDIIAVKILMGRKDEALKMTQSTDFIDPMDAARLYTMLEIPDEALDWIEKGYEERSVMMVTLKHSWLWDPLRDNPRFIEIYNRMNF